MSLDFNIVTLHRAENYGAILQAYALQEFLKINGYTVGVYDSIQVKAPRNKSLKAIISRIYSLRDIVHQKEYKNKRRKFSANCKMKLNI